jgi:hypothetical protein
VVVRFGVAGGDADACGTDHGGSARVSRSSKGGPGSARHAVSRHPASPDRGVGRVSMRPISGQRVGWTGPAGPAGGGESGRTWGFRNLLVFYPFHTRKVAGSIPAGTTHNHWSERCYQDHFQNFRNNSGLYPAKSVQILLASLHRAVVVCSGGGNRRWACAWAWAGRGVVVVISCRTQLGLGRVEYIDVQCDSRAPVLLAVWGAPIRVATVAWTRRAGFSKGAVSLGAVRRRG